MDNGGYNGNPQQQGSYVPPPQPQQPYGGYGEPPAEPKKSKNKAVTAVLIILIILLALAIAGLLLWQSGVFTKSVTIFFDSDGGSKIETMTVKAGEEITLPEPKKTNYKFDGWALDGKPVTSPFSTEEDVLLKAKWSPVYITVTFYSDVDLPTVDVQFLPGDKLVYPDPEDLPVIKGFTVIGWSDLDGKEVPEGTTVKNDMTLVPILSMNVFRVTFDSDGGSSVPSLFIEEGEAFHAPTPPTKAGYTFVCWVDKNGNPVYDGALLAMEDITLKATWQKKAYTISFDSTGGSSVAPVTFYEGEPIKLPSPPVRDGYTFVCWGDKWGIPIYDGALLAGENVTLYAQWAEIFYTITFDSNGGSAVAPLKFTDGQTITLPAPPTKSGYRFAHWEDKNGMPILDGAKLYGEDFTLYAVWQKLYTITFDSDGGSYVAPIQFVEGDTFKEPPKPTIDSPAIFITWVDPDGHPVHNGDPLDPKDMVFTAIWN